MADGELVFNTKIDTEDIGKGLNKLRSTLNTSAKNIGEKMASGIKSGMNGIVTATRSSANTMENVFANSAKKISSVFSRLGRMIKGVFLFSVIFAALKKLKTALSDSLNSSKEFSSAMARLRSALSSAFQPLIQTILPYLIKFVNWLAKALSFVGDFLKILFGTAKGAKNLTFNLNKQNKTMRNTGKVAKEASKSLLNFDEIQKLTSEKKETSAPVDDVVDAASELENIDKKISDTTQKTAVAAQDIAVSGSKFANELELAVANLTKKLSAIKIKLDSDIAPVKQKFVNAMKDIWGNAGNDLQPAINAWKTGVTNSWANFGTEMSKAWAKLKEDGNVLDFALTFGKALWQAVKDTAVASWEFIKEAAPIFWQAIKDAAAASWEFIKEAAPIFWQAIKDAAAAAWEFIKEAAPIFWQAIKDAASTLWDIIKEVGPKFWNAIKEVASTLWDLIKEVGPKFWDAIVEVADTLWTALEEVGPKFWDAIVKAVSDLWDAMPDIALEFWKAITDCIEKLFTKLAEVGPKFWDAIVKAVDAFFDWLSKPGPNNLGTKIWDAIVLTVSTLVKVIPKIAKFVWDALLGIIKLHQSIMKGILKLFWNNFLNVGSLLIEILGKLATLLWQAIKSKISSIGSLITGIFKKNKTLSPQKLSIPALAQGAVIPPNSQFLAMLGDQKSGTNIETPLATMVQAFKQAMAESGMNSSNRAVMQVDGITFAQLVYKYNNKEQNRIGINLVERTN